MKPAIQPQPQFKMLKTPHLVKPFLYLSLLNGALPYTVENSPCNTGSQPALSFKFSFLSGVLSIVGLASRLWALSRTVEKSSFDASSMTDLFNQMANWTIDLLGLTFRIFFLIYGKGLANLVTGLAQIEADFEETATKKITEHNSGLKQRLVRYWVAAKWPLYVLGVTWFTTSVVISISLHIFLLRSSDNNLTSHLAGLAQRRLTNCHTPFCGFLVVVADLVFWSTDFCLLDLALITISKSLVELQKKLRNVVMESRSAGCDNGLDVKLTSIHWKIFDVAKSVSNYVGSLIALEYIFMLIYLTARFVACVKVLLDHNLKMPYNFSHQAVRLIVHFSRVVITLSATAAVQDEVCCQKHALGWMSYLSDALTRLPE